jgi:flagellar capping protein FliD
MKEVYYLVLFILVTCLVFIFRQKLEHMTVEELDDKFTERISTLEDEYSSLKQKIDTQESKMKAATSQATDAQALLDSNLVE